MRGGKRENAGRKGLYETKTIRIPTALETDIAALIEKYKASLTQEKPVIDSVTKSKAPAVPMLPMLSKEQKRRLRIWLTFHGFEDNMTNARKATETPKLTKETVLKYCAPAEEKYKLVNR